MLIVRDSSGLNFLTSRLVGLESKLVPKNHEPFAVKNKTGSHFLLFNHGRLETIRENIFTRETIIWQSLAGNCFSLNKSLASAKGRKRSCNLEI